jgi:hypothetical protein
MDTTKQLHEADARGWQRGLYDDVKATFRAPVVNWIWRTLMANDPAFCRYAWGQLKPVFETRAFARLTVRYRDAVLSALEAEGPLPAYRPRAVGLSPAEFRELQGQLATYDVVAPRLAVLFEVADRTLHDDSVGGSLPDERAATRPFPDWLDSGRGRPPTLGDEADIDTALAGTAAAIRAFHGFDESLPSIYRTLIQWPPYLERAWADLEPRLDSAAFETACADADALVGGFVDGLAHRPRLDPAALRGTGFGGGTIEGAQVLFRRFNTGPVETVLPALPVLAATVDATGEREAL